MARTDRPEVPGGVFSLQVARLSAFPARASTQPEERGTPLPADEVVRLAALHSYKLLDTPPDPKLQAMTRLAAQMFDVPIALVTLIDDRRQWVKAAWGRIAPGTETRREHSFCAHTILRPDQPMVVEDAAEDGRFQRSPLVTGASGVRFYAGVPLLGHEGRAIGALCLMDSKPRGISDSALGSLADLAQCVAGMLEAYRLNAVLEESLDHHRTALELSPQIPWVATPIGELLELGPRFAQVTGKVDARLLRLGWMDLVHPADLPNAKRVWARSQQTGEQMDVEMRVRLRDGAYHWFRSYAQPRRGDDGAILSWYGAMEDIEDRKHAQAQVERLADHDTLTGLFNRHRCRIGLDAQIAAGAPFALLSLDLDNLKAVNNTLGHRVGDAILRRAAERLDQCIGTGDLLARSGGDEFLIIQAGTGTAEDAASLAKCALAAMVMPAQLEGHSVNLGISIGIALFPENGTDADSLLQSAALALSRAKAEGRGTFRFFEPGMDDSLRKQQALKVDLRDAIKRGQLHLAFQPLVNVRTCRVESFEALLRWRHPVWGNVSPVDFIPIAESSGLIVSIGQWVLEQACLQATAWPEDISVSVNLSAVQFRGGGLAEMVAQTLAETKLSPTRLELEVTESLPLLDDADNRAALQMIKQLGVRIALDDFGTGYASLGYLQSFPFDKLKIDRSIAARVIEGEKARAIVRAIVGMSHTLQIAVTAEGAETLEQMSALRDEGCDQVQGYFFSRPVPADEVAALISTLQPPCREAGS